MLLSEYIVNLYERNKVHTIFYKNEFDCDNEYNNKDKLKDIVEKLTNKGILVYSIEMFDCDEDFTKMKQDMPIHFDNLDDLSKFTDLLSLCAKEVSIWILNFKNTIWYYVDIFHNKLDYYYNSQKYSMDIRISDLTYSQVKMLEIFLKRLELNGNDGHSEMCTLFADGDGDFRPKININTNVTNDIASINRGLISRHQNLFKFFIDYKNNVKTEFGVFDSTFNDKYLPALLMEKFEEWNNGKN